MVLLNIQLHLLQAESHAQRDTEDSSQQALCSLMTGGPADSWLVFGHVKFEGVSLQYARGGAWAVREVDLEIQPGQSVGIVGRTGLSL